MLDSELELLGYGHLFLYAVCTMGLVKKELKGQLDAVTPQTTGFARQNLVLL